MVTVTGNGIGDQSSNLNEKVCVSFYVNSIEKDMNAYFPSPRHE